MSGVGAVLSVSAQRRLTFFFLLLALRDCEPLLYFSVFARLAHTLG